MHTHVDADLHSEVAVRNLTAATFGLVGSLPAQATTGCGIRVPYVETSTEPDSVTCPPCREYAHRRYLELADYVVRATDIPGTPPDLRARAARARTEYQELAGRYAAPRE
ncbi:hypothetical protein Val02_28990 [Virgisporangium aliadipatigenens]|uniref:Uncharacterized protein n=1 Tax=Virgisporangium aliadipatigenens TaxID=741659 RepID=A0A8J3YLL4_9ACTN|nr:hypothetical protein [Virgisporangium aliadipatigenens]GIJ46013.1 hypothetical protein Val02_28990 [Virgisporangium aliadipatigenens]